MTGAIGPEVESENLGDKQPALEEVKLEEAPADLDGVRNINALDLGPQHNHVVVEIEEAERRLERQEAEVPKFEVVPNEP